MEKALSESDILDIIDGKARVMTYQELQKYNDLNKALGKHGAIVLLYTTSKNYGHWVALFKVNDNLVEFFDSYGYPPDDELKFVPEYFRKNNYGDYPHLTSLLYDSGYNIIYNEYQLQKEKKGINTCGRWVALRLLFRNIPQQIFSKYFYSKKNPDKLAVELTNEI